MWARFAAFWERLPWLTRLMAPSFLVVALVALGVWSPVALLVFGIGALFGFLGGVGLALERPRSKPRSRTSGRRARR